MSAFCVQALHFICYTHFIHLNLTGVFEVNTLLLCILQRGAEPQKLTTTFVGIRL